MGTPLRGKVQFPAGRGNRLYYAIQRVLFNDRCVARETIECGDPILNEYGPTSTIEGCAEISRDGYLSAGDLYAHYIFKNGYLPKRFKKSVIGPAGDHRQPGFVYFGLDAIKAVMRKFGVTVTGQPQRECRTFPYQGRNTPEQCAYLTDAFYGAGILRGSADAFAGLGGRGSLSATSVLAAFNRWMLDEVDDSLDKNLPVEILLENPAHYPEIYKCE